MPTSKRFEISTARCGGLNSYQHITFTITWNRHLGKGNSAGCFQNKSFHRGWNVHPARLSVKVLHAKVTGRMILSPACIVWLKIMPNVETSIWINAPIATVYAIAKDSEKYPEYMKAVESLTVTERNDSRVVAEWVGLITQFNLKVRWTQEEVWDDANTRSVFRQLKGDYDKMEGTWVFTEENGGTLFAQTLDYEYNVPTLGPLVKKLVLHLVKSQLEAAGEAIKNRAEAQHSA